MALKDEAEAGNERIIKREEIRAAMKIAETTGEGRRGRAKASEALASQSPVMKKVIVYAVLLLLCTPGLALAAEWGCVWSTEECTTFVTHSLNRWEMIIMYDDGTMRRFTGKGEWGGWCKGYYIDLSIPLLGLPDTSR
jgi:hypothetical protein